MNAIERTKGNLQLRFRNFNKEGSVVLGAEIVVRESDHAYTLAFWKYDKDGYSLVFVANRPFGPEVKRKAFMKLAKFGQKQLDALEKENQDD